MSEASITVGGRIFAGWLSVSVTRSIEAIAGGFSLSVTDRFSETDALWALTPGLECRVDLDGQTVISGYIDELSTRISADAREITVSGRDKTGDIVDCSVRDEPAQFKKQTLLQLASSVCSPHGVDVTLATDAGEVFKTAAIQPGESVFEFLERHARTRGVLLVPDMRGGLIITGPGKTKASTALVEGKNILSASVSINASRRFATYTVKGHTAGADDSWDVKRSVKGSVTDEGVRKNRKLLIVAEGEMTLSAAKTRAQWESTVRNARATTISVTVTGWTQENGKLWRLNDLVELQAPKLGVSGTFLITETTFSQSSDAGTVTVLELRHKDAFSPEPIQKKTSDKIGLGWEIK
jgi:prophage tail gpP-like protein